MITIRDYAGGSDTSAIARLIIDVLGYPSMTEARIAENLKEIDKHSGYKTFVAEVDGTVCGFIGLRIGPAYEIAGEMAQIMALAVDDSCQGKGIGSALLMTAEEYARSKGAAGVFLTSNMRRTAAHAFYESRGYDRTSFAFKKFL